MEVWNDGFKEKTFPGDPGSFPNLPLFQYSTIPDVWRNNELP